MPILDSLMTLFLFQSMEGDPIGTEECQWDNDNLDFLLESIGNDLSSISYGP